MELNNFKRAKRDLLALSIVSASLVMVGCGGSNNTASFDDAALKTLITASGLTGDPTTGRTLPAITDAKAQLGKRLFFTKGLGGEENSACVTCHHPTLGGGDNLALPIGVDAEIDDLLGVGRFHDAVKAAADNNSEFDGGPTVPRNAPTTFNIGLWDKVLFHDGRVESLSTTTAGLNGAGGGIRTPDSVFGVADANSGTTLPTAQSRFPVTSPEEMRGFNNPGATSVIRAVLVPRLAADWNAEFNTAFGDAVGVGPDYSRIAEAIGEYERSQIFVATPFKSYIEGDNSAMSESAKRGASQFFNTIANGGANCVSCHSGDFMTDEDFHVLAVPQIGRGKGDNNGTNGNDDFGRSRETSLDVDKYQFRTPTLLNVEVTGPYGHDGAYSTLEAMVRHHLNPATAVAGYNFGQLAANIQAQDMVVNTQFHLDRLTANRAANVSNVLQDVVMTDSQVTDMVEFMKALTDPCVKDRACLSAWIPSVTDANPDGLRINAIDQNGNFL